MLTVFLWLLSVCRWLVGCDHFVPLQFFMLMVLIFKELVQLFCLPKREDTLLALKKERKAWFVVMDSQKHPRVMQFDALLKNHLDFGFKICIHLYCQYSVPQIIYRCRCYQQFYSNVIAGLVFTLFVNTCKYGWNVLIKESMDVFLTSFCLNYLCIQLKA